MWIRSVGGVRVPHRKKFLDYLRIPTFPNPNLECIEVNDDSKITTTTTTTNTTHHSPLTNNRPPFPVMPICNPSKCHSCNPLNASTAPPFFSPIFQLSRRMSSTWRRLRTPVRIRTEQLAQAIGLEPNDTRPGPPSSFDAHSNLMHCPSKK
jgi:hypothetical protein